MCFQALTRSLNTGTQWVDLHPHNRQLWKLTQLTPVILYLDKLLNNTNKVYAEESYSDMYFERCLSR